jgi:hypothetical protein
MRTRVATLTVLAVVAIAGSSASAPPQVEREPAADHKEGHGLACTGRPCKVSPYPGNLPEKFALAKMEKLGCDPPFNHLGGIKEGETSWVGFSCPEHVKKEFDALPHDFHDACLPKRHGRVYVPVFEGHCSLTPLPDYQVSPEMQEKLKNFGCGPFFHYGTGNGNGILGGNGTYCKDTPALRATHPMGYGPGYCDGCLKVPPGEIFVLWTTAIGPNCPNGCPMDNDPDRF